MKKAEEYMKEFWDPNTDDNTTLIDVIKQAQIDAIDAAVKMCAENAELKEFNVTPQDRDSISNDMGDVYAVDLEKILSIADKLKKELE